jgi:hypothetical protein
LGAPRRYRFSPMARGVAQAAVPLGAQTACFRAWGYLPITPLPLGFALDTALYGGITGALHLLLGALRRSLRRRRGRCAWCDYPLPTPTPTTTTATTRCPECGRQAGAQR